MFKRIWKAVKKFLCRSKLWQKRQKKPIMVYGQRLDLLEAIERDVLAKDQVEVTAKETNDRE